MATIRRRPPDTATRAAQTATLDRSHAGVKARAQAAGFRGSKEKVNKTFKKNAAHIAEVRARPRPVANDRAREVANDRSAVAGERIDEAQTYPSDVGNTTGRVNATLANSGVTRAIPRPTLTFAAVKARAIAAGKNPTTAQVNATLEASRKRAAAR